MSPNAERPPPGQRGDVRKAGSSAKAHRTKPTYISAAMTKHLDRMYREPACLADLERRVARLEKRCA